MRIVWLAEHRWPATVGGVELQVEAISKWMRRGGHEVELWIGDMPTGWTERRPDGRMMYGLGIKASPRRLWRINPLVKLFRAVWRLPRRGDVVFSPHPLLTAGHLVKNRDIPIIYCPGGTMAGSYSWHFPGDQKRFGPARQFLWVEKQCLKRSAGIVAVSSSVRRQMVKVVPGCERRIEVIHTGYEPEETQEPRPGEIFTVICVARLFAIKNIGFLIEAWKRVGYVNKRLVIVGEGEQRGMLETLAGGRGDVQFLGERLDVFHWLAESDVFVLPSRYEACPLAVIEAMGAGLPCITLRSVEGVSEVGASGEINIDGETGFCVDPGDPREMAERLDFLAVRVADRRRMGQSARKKALEQLTWQQMAGEYVRMASRVIEGRVRRGGLGN